MADMKKYRTFTMTMIHQSVNHTAHFIDKNTGARIKSITKTVKSLWILVKTKLHTKWRLSTYIRPPKKRMVPIIPSNKISNILIAI